MSSSLVVAHLRILSTTGSACDLDVILPKSFLARARGLLGRARLVAGHGMLFERCSSVHCFGMTRCIDVVFARRDGVVLKCISALPPCSVAFCHGAYYTLELEAGGIAGTGIRKGDRFEISPQFHG